MSGCVEPAAVCLVALSTFGVANDERTVLRAALVRALDEVGASCPLSADELAACGDDAACARAAAGTVAVDAARARAVRLGDDVDLTIEIAGADGSWREARTKTAALAFLQDPKLDDAAARALTPSCAATTTAPESGVGSSTAASSPPVGAASPPWPLVVAGVGAGAVVVGAAGTLAATTILETPSTPADQKALAFLVGYGAVGLAAVGVVGAAAGAAWAVVDGAAAPAD